MANQGAGGAQTQATPNIFQQSAGAYTDALSQAQSAASSARGISARGGGFQSISAPQNVEAERLSGMNLDPYMNPYTDDVIDTTVSEIDRQRQIAMNRAGGEATAAGAFGGSRHGVYEAEMGRGFDENMARAIAQLNQQNFSQAQQAGQFDIGNTLQADLSNQNTQLQTNMSNQNARIQAAQVAAQAAAAKARAQAQVAQTQGNLSNLGFGMGMSVNNAMMGQGAMQQALQQRLFDQGAQQFGGFANSPQQSLGAASSALGATPVPMSETTSKQPGLFDYLTMGATAGASMFCWVAREVYGLDNPEWLDFRAWMLTEAPEWLRKAYIKRGPGIAKWVKRNPWSKRLLRPVMDWLKG